MNVLVPFDISPLSKRAIATALDLFSGKNDVHIIAVHVSGGEDPPAEIAAHEIEEMGAEHGISIDAETHITEHGADSKAAIRNAITDIIDDREIDLVILGHEEKSLFEEMFRSDTSERVLTVHEVPVLLVP